MTKTPLFIAAAALAFGAAAPAHAQTTGTDQSPGTGTSTVPEQAQTAIPDALLTAFVTAALEVNDVAADYQSQMEASADDAERQTVSEEAQLAMIEAIEETDGITVEEYLAIAQSAQADPALNDRVMRKYEELSEEG